jgi:hypothetical protein
MNLKQFLKPDWRKIILFIILSIAFVLVMKFPLNWEHLDWGGCVGGCDYRGVCVDCAPNYKILIVNLIFDLIFWYFLSCLIFWVYDKLKKKP